MQKKSNVITEGGKVLTAAILGAAAGATAVALANKDTREKLRSTTGELLKKGEEGMRMAQKEAKGLQKAGKQKLDSLRMGKSKSSKKS